ncbi:MAG: HDOD domain-containing protein [Deltaproteobacteria bacterium]|nr:HDOD domain-containing protein [Candidatus Anaeroferrophillacea bacterium]
MANGTGPRPAVSRAAWIARQPIFDDRKRIYAYELLFRDGAAAGFTPGMDGDQATAKVLENTLLNIGMDVISGDRKAFVNFTRNLLLKRVPLLLPRENVVVEILEDVTPDEELLAACREIAAAGYLLALDDFIWMPELEPLIALAGIIKFDFRLSTMDEIIEYLARLPSGSPRRLLAEKVETNEEFEQARDLGFTLFQGYFFCRPEVVEGREISSSQLTRLQVMGELGRESFDFGTLEQIVSHDVSTSYKLLRYINSPFFAKPSPITSIRQALVYMGEQELRRFMALMTISSLAAGKPGELITISCIRGKFCELIGALPACRARPAELFTVGMFSLLDAIMDQPMSAIMAQLPLSDELKAALTEHRGMLAGYLALVIAWELGKWNAVSRIAARLHLDEAELPPLFAEACRWADAVAAV